MLKRTMKLLHRQHTASHRAHEHTSYVGLFVLLAIVGVSLTAFTTTAFLATPGPDMRSIGIVGTVPGEPPTVAATIESPANGTRFTETPVTISGTCPPQNLVEVFKNDIFAGSTVCGSDGRYSIEIDLMIGRNDLIARVYDALNQEGPPSATVTVFYDISPTEASQLSPLSFGGDQLILNTDAVFRGTFPEQQMSVPIDIIGGRAPYAVNIQWGDATNRVVSRPTNGTFRVEHAYSRAGTYTLSIQATDADDRVAFLSVAAIVNGQPYLATGTAVPPESTLFQRLMLLWPLYAIVLSMVVSFWLGELREKRLLIKRGAILPA